MLPVPAETLYVRHATYKLLLATEDWRPLPRIVTAMHGVSTIWKQGSIVHANPETTLQDQLFVEDIFLQKTEFTTSYVSRLHNGVLMVRFLDWIYQCGFVSNLTLLGLGDLFYWVLVYPDMARLWHRLTSAQTDLLFIYFKFYLTNKIVYYYCLKVKFKFQFTNQCLLKHNWAAITYILKNDVINTSVIFKQRTVFSEK